MTSAASRSSGRSGGGALAARSSRSPSTQKRAPVRPCSSARRWPGRAVTWTGTATAPACQMPSRAPRSDGRLPIRTMHRLVGRSRVRAALRDVLGDQNVSRAEAPRARRSCSRSAGRSGPSASARIAGERSVHASRSESGRRARRARRLQALAAGDVHELRLVGRAGALDREVDGERLLERLEHVARLVGAVDGALGLLAPGSGRSRRCAWRSRARVASSSAAGTTRLTMPSSRARAAGMRSSPSRMISLAIFGPTIQGRIIATMPAPNFSSGSPKNASSDAIVMSQASASSQAPARHGPAHRRDGRPREVPEPHDGVEILAQQRLPLLRRPAGRRSICSLRSKPDENAAPAPAHDHGADRRRRARSRRARRRSRRASPG